MPDIARELLKGSYDLHVHTAPSHFNRKQDDFELAKTMDEFEMAGAVIKAHYGATTTRALLVNRYAQSKSKVYGAVTLDWTVGGLNPYAVESELLLGAKIVWLPTFHALNHLEKTKGTHRQPVEAPGIRITDDRDRLFPVVYDIMDLVKSYHAVLQTGHSSPMESFVLCSEAAARGVTVVLTHPDNRRENVPLDLQEKLAKLGVFIDRSWFNIVKGESTPAQMAERIRRTSPSQCIMSTDLGQIENDRPADGLLAFTRAMLNEGISQDNLTVMMRDNPFRLLHL